MWSFFRKLFPSSEQELSVRTIEDDVSQSTLVFRGGRAAAPDEAFFASFSNDVSRMVAALDVETNSIDRHFLLQTLVKETYRLRKQEEMAGICLATAALHLKEFPSLIEPLKEAFGVLPRVSTFQHYATLLAERGDFEKAIHVCQVAIAYGLQDGTKSGFEGRIKRIQKVQISG